MKYTLRFLLLGAVLYVSGSACLAQSPFLPFDYYNLLAWACSPVNCSNDEGPVFTGSVTMETFGECTDQVFPDVREGVWAAGCATFIELTSYGDTVETNYTDDFGDTFLMDGVRAQAWSKDYYTNFPFWYGYTTQWCDGGIEGFSPAPNPC